MYSRLLRWGVAGGEKGKGERGKGKGERGTLNESQKRLLNKRLRIFKGITGEDSEEFPFPFPPFPFPFFNSAAPPPTESPALPTAHHRGDRFLGFRWGW